MKKVIIKYTRNLILIAIFLITLQILHQETSKILAKHSIYTKQRYILDVQDYIEHKNRIANDFFIKFVITDMGKNFTATQLAVELSVPSILIFAPNINNATHWMQKGNQNNHTIMMEILIDADEENSLSAEYALAKNDEILQNMLQNIPEYVSLYINDSLDNLIENDSIVTALLNTNREIYSEKDYRNSFDIDITGMEFPIASISEFANITHHDRKLILNVNASYKNIHVIQELINQILIN